MSYFSYFPMTNYELNFNSLEYKMVRNILVRAKFNESLKQSESLSSAYFVKDGERPDTLSYKIYNRSDLHWLILLVNEMHDPYYSWPMSQSQLDSYIDKKYPGVAIYLATVDLIAAKGDNVYQKSDGVYTKIGTVHKWDPTYLKLEVDGTDELISVDSCTGFTIRVGETGRDVTAFRTELNKYSINHFNNQGLEVGAFASIEDPERVPLPNQEGRLIETYAKNGSTPTIQNYVVDNYTHEQELNDARREIRVLKPEYTDTVFRLMRNAFKGV